LAIILCFHGKKNLAREAVYFPKKSYKVMTLNEDSAVKENNVSAGLPAHETVYRTLRERILFGELTPGQAVTIQGLIDQLGAGMTPVREAIRRLTAEGALVFQGNRRVCVPILSQANLDELAFARSAIEKQLVFLAAQRVTPTEIAALREIDAALDSAIAKGDVGTYLRCNYEFHKALYHMANAPILTHLADGLWLRYGPSLRVVCGRLGTQNLVDQHKQAIAAMVNKDPHSAAEAMSADVTQGMDQVALALHLQER
jgi:DNA-binding GntR family transcriptional regulator